MTYPDYWSLKNQSEYWLMLETDGEATATDLGLSFRRAEDAQAHPDRLNERYRLEDTPQRVIVVKVA